MKNSVNQTGVQPSRKREFHQPVGTATPTPTVMIFFSVLLMAGSSFAQDISVTAPTEAVVGSEISINFNGNARPQDFITIVAADAPEGKYEAYQYARKSPVTLLAPVIPGDYEVRYLDAAGPYLTRWRQAIKIIDTVADLEAAVAVAAGGKIEVHWKGPDNPSDFISIVADGAAEGTYEKGYVYTKQGSPVTLEVPDAAGQYEVRYLMGQSPYRTLGRRTLTVTGTTATLTVPSEVNAGAAFSFDWTGPDNKMDFITIVAAGAADKAYGEYVYTDRGSPAKLTAPEEPGAYEVRYMTGQSYTVLARATIEVVPVNASVHGPTAVEARGVATVTWEGPGNALDYVIIHPAGAGNTASGPYAYTSRGTELRLEVPQEPGQYEFRYITGGKNLVLARQAVTVTPRPVPGSLRVLDSSRQSTALGGASVTVVLDASGSMLQRIAGERRIDIAKAAVKRLVAQDLPADVRFSLRVFGHKEKDSCRTDVEIPLAPLNRTQALATVTSITAMNLAKTPIAASLSEVGADLARVAGPHLVILLTDGEETCAGDPAAVIQSLIASGLDIRINIVGFAIDELMLRETFQAWARLGKGQYIDAQNAQELTSGLARAIEMPYQVFNQAGDAVMAGTINGPAVELPAGEYSVHTEMSTKPLSVKIKEDEESLITLGAKP